MTISRRNFINLAGASALAPRLANGRSGATQSQEVGASGAEVRTVKLTEIQDPLTNPYGGWGIWVAPRQLGYTKPDYTVASNTTEFGDDAPLFGWVMVDWDWAHLEPKEGVFDFEDLDAVIQYWATRGKQFVLRLWVTSDPGWKNEASSVSVVPQWLWDKGLKYREYVVTGTVDISSSLKQRQPDYLDPSYEALYLPALQKLLHAIASRYDKPGTPIVLVQIVGYGEWVDFSAWFLKYPWPDFEIKRVFFTRLVDLFASTFKNIQLMMAYMGDWDKNPEWSVKTLLESQAADVAIAKGACLEDTGFIVARAGTRWTRLVVDQYWKTLPFLGEGWAYDEIKDVGTYGTIAENAKIVLQYHTNFYHFYSFAQSYRRMMRDDRPVLETGLRRGGLGHRLVLSSASWPRQVPAGHLLLIDQEWTNRNVGRLYVHHPLKVCLLDGQGQERFSGLDWDIDVTSLLKDEVHTRTSVIQLPEDLSSGEYELRVALADKSGKPRIRLAIQGGDAEMRYKLGTVRILPRAPART